MGIIKKSGHAVTSVVPKNADSASVKPATVVFPQAPAHQSGGMGGPRVNKGTKGASPRT